MSTSRNPALERDALYGKSQVYIKRGLRAQEAGDTEEYQLWASLALELLGKGALAKIHPALVAEPTHYESLFAACGRPISPEIRTITAKTIFVRLSHLEKLFDQRHQRFCEQLSIRRNAELHSGESPFSGMSPESWEREYWGAIEMILKMQNESLESWLGAEDAKAPEALLENAVQALQWAVKNRIARCKEDFEKKVQDPKRRAQLIELAKSEYFHDYTWDGNDRKACPSCTASAFIAGSLWNEEVIDTDEGWYNPEEEGDYELPTETVEQTFTTEYFHCPVCDLRFFGTKEIAAAALPEDFSKKELREREFGEGYNNE